MKTPLPCSDSYSKEACVETLVQAQKAALNGADQIELCSDLHLEGLTPSYELTREIINKLAVPVKVMLRNRAGNFVYNATDIEIMLRQLERLKELDIIGVVFGALTEDNILDIPTISKIALAAQPLPLTIHKCIDQVENYKEDINSLKLIPNVKYILSSGRKSTAYNGAEHLLKMKDYASPEIEIIAAGKITSSNISQLDARLNLNFYHGKRIV